MMDEQDWRNRRLPAAGWVQTRAELLQALEAYRRGIAEAPVVCKWVQPSLPSPQLFAQEAEGSHTRGNHKDCPYDGVGRADQPSRALGNVRCSYDGVGRDAGDVLGRALTFVASTGEVDRHGDTVALDGWKLDEYRQNPVVLWAHDYRQPAIGLTEAVWNNGRALLARMHFAPTGFAKEVEGLYRQGYQRGVSVGFRPVRFEERRDLRSGALLGIQFLEHELLEISAVPVPANSQALLAGVLRQDQDERSGPHANALPEGAGTRLGSAVVSLLRELRTDWHG